MKSLGAVVALILVAAGCAEYSGPVTATDVQLSFVQIRIDEGTNRAQLRVINDSDRDLQVTGVGLDWPGYGDFLLDYDTVVDPGRVLDLRVTLPEPRCTPTDAPVTGVLRVGDEVIRDRLDESGWGYVTRIWERRCHDLEVTQGVSITYGKTWRLVGTGRDTWLVGSLQLDRKAAVGPIEITRVLGSVLLELHLRTPAVLPAGSDRASFPLRIRVPRCDSHALSESSQTFHFQIWVRFGDGAALGVIRMADARTRAGGQALLVAACE
jgi:hypothetical protein